MKTSPIQSSILDLFSSLWTQLRAAARIPVNHTKHYASELQGESDFEAWLRDDPQVTMDPANQYGTRMRGYLTSNGRGSLEIGAADE